MLFFKSKIERGLIQKMDKLRKAQKATEKDRDSMVDALKKYRDTNVITAENFDVDSKDYRYFRFLSVFASWALTDDKQNLFSSLRNIGYNVYYDLKENGFKCCSAYSAYRDENETSRSITAAIAEFFSTNQVFHVTLKEQALSGVYRSLVP